jgi:RNA polymerase sigma-70 factor (ECF subfamily)
VLGEEFTSVLAGAQSGAEWAWARLYESVAGQAVGYLRLRGAREPEDLLGEVFVQVARNLGTFEGDERDFRAWVFTVAHHRLVDERRYFARRPVEALGADDSAGGNVEQEALRFIANESVRNMLAQLSPDQRDVLLLRLLGGLSVAETADALGKNPGAIKALHHRGIRTLRSRAEQTAVTN